MIRHIEISKALLFTFIRRQQIKLAGNRRLKIYGRLNCKAGRRMKKENRVFFSNEAEAIREGFVRALIA